MTTTTRTPLRKIPGHLLPDRPEKASCVRCSATGPDVALMARGDGLARMCRTCDRTERADQIRAELRAMWPQLADDFWHGRYRADLGRVVDADVVFGVLTTYRPDVSPHARWELWADLEDAVTLRRRIRDGYYRPRDLACADEAELEQLAATRVDDAVNALMGGDR